MHSNAEVARAARFIQSIVIKVSGYARRVAVTRDEYPRIAWDALCEALAEISGEKLPGVRTEELVHGTDLIRRLAEAVTEASRQVPDTMWSHDPTEAANEVACHLVLAARKRGLLIIGT